MILSRIAPRLLSPYHATILVCDLCREALEVNTFTSDPITEEKIIHSKVDMTIIEEFKNTHEKCEKAFYADM